MILSSMVFIPLVASPIVYLIGRRSDRGARILSLAAALPVLGMAIYAYGLILQRGGGAELSFVEGPYRWIPSFEGVDYFLGIDGLSAPLVLVSALLSVLVILGSWDLIKERQPLYYGLVLLFEGSMIGVFASMNLVLFYVFWEVVLVPMFFFIGIWGGPRRKYAAMKFLIFTYLGSVVMLLGFLALYLFSSKPTFNITEVSRLPFTIQALASVATFAGFGVKLPVVPFHTWLPDAHVEAPAPISVFLAGLLLKMGGYGFIRINLGLFPDVSREFGWVFIILGLVTMFYGAVVAFIQRDLKRMIALTSINHMGFVLLGAFTGNIYGISGAIFQMFNHAVAIGLLFMLSGYIHEQAGTRDINELKGLKAIMPRTTSLIILGSMAAMGVPIYSNFISEYMVIVGAMSVDIRYAVAILIPIITVAYFLWMMKRTIMSQPSHEPKGHDMTLGSAFTLSLYLLPLFLFLAFPWLVLGMTDPIARLLMLRLGGGG